MNFVQTLYISPNKNLFYDSFGWIAPEYHLMSWALSCLLLKQSYPNVKLYANAEAAACLIDDLKLPYDEVYILSDKFKLPHPTLWALPKLWTYNLQKDPFLHIDGDVFVFERFPETLINAELAAQNEEISTEFYLSTQRELIDHFAYFPDCVKKDFEANTPFKAVNAGILGGHNIDFIQKYTTEAFSYIDKNVQYLDYLDNPDRFNVFFEQHLFYAMAKKRNLSIELLFETIFKDNAYSGIGNIYETPYPRNYIHLLGHFKRDIHTCNQMAAKLQELYPNYYSKILELFKTKGVPFNKNFCRYTGKNSFIENENSNLLLLKKISLLNKQQDDFDEFYKKLLDILNKNISVSYLNERDIEYCAWYKKFFYNDNFFESIIIRCPEIEIIVSDYNWSGLFNKVSRSASKYYQKLKFEKGKFYHLVVPEVSQNRFSLYDIDEFDNEILNNLTQPISIRNFLQIMSENFEEDVLRNNYDDFLASIKFFLTQLLLKKAIKPL